AAGPAGPGCRSPGRGAGWPGLPLPGPRRPPRITGHEAARPRVIARSTYRGGVNSGQMIDWDVAISTGVRWVRPGPQVSLADARAVVAELRELAVAVAEPVHEVTGMISAEDAGRVAVVDRAGWIRANVD